MELLKYIVPALIVLLVTYLILFRFFRNEAERRSLELRKMNLQIVTPTRLRAYERLTLLLERVNPNNMLVRKIESSTNCIEFQSTILNDIRKEFEHNAAQQIYVSESLWEDIEEARENLIQLINSAATQCAPEDPATRLASIIIEVFNTPEETALSAALRNLKAEVSQIFQ
ncbi:MAG: hypothetical protein GX102_06150 [Porphyromonadaceae bacterium]|nr:hypothetical protein [Porphyromonadaceae bacterium]